MENVKKKKINGWMISTIILAALYLILLITALHYMITNNKNQISYNGIEYDSSYAYVNIEFNNSTNEQIVFDKTNFSIKNTATAKTALNMYVNNSTQVISSYTLKSQEKVKVKLQFNKSDLNAETTLYYNGSAISKL